MKKILFAFLAAACLLSSCSKDSTNEGDGQTISISCGEIINASPAGEALPVTVTSSGAWRLAGVSDWVHPSVVKGGNGDQLTLTIDPNKTEEARTATFKFFTGSAISTLTINSDPNKRLLLVSEAEMNCTQGKQDIIIGLNTNIETFDFSYSDGGGEWIAYTSRSDAFGTTSMNFTVQANAGYDPRSSEITISADGVEPVKVKLSQLQTDAIKIEKLVESFTFEASELTINLETNVEYTVEIPTKYQSWIHRKTTLESRGLVGASESFTIDAAAGLRSGKIIFKSKDGATSTTVMVVQTGDTHIYATIPDAKFQNYLFDNDFAVPVANETSKIELTLDGIDATVFNFPQNGGIASVEGIEAFTKLKKLNCNYNNLKLIALGSLPVTEVTMRQAKTSGDVVVSGDNIEIVDAYYVPDITSLDVSACPKINRITISYCYYLSTLYLKTGATPTISASATGIDVGGYKKVYK